MKHDLIKGFEIEFAVILSVFLINIYKYFQPPIGILAEILGNYGLATWVALPVYLLWKDVARDKVRYKQNATYFIFALTFSPLAILNNIIPNYLRDTPLLNWALSLGYLGNTPVFEMFEDVLLSPINVILPTLIYQIIIRSKFFH